MRGASAGDAAREMCRVMGFIPILITNDDGYGTEGINTLEESLSDLGTVWVVAPDREQSGQGHALSLHHPLRFEQRGPRSFAVQGTPTDCIYLGVNQIMKDKPRIVVSGINQGVNLGDDITYSGTVSAAFEGTLMSVPSFAVSQQVTGEGASFAAAGRFARALVETIMQRGLPRDTLVRRTFRARAPRLEKIEEVAHIDDAVAIDVRSARGGLVFARADVDRRIESVRRARVIGQRIVDESRVSFEVERCSRARSKASISNGVCTEPSDRTRSGIPSRR